MNVYEPKISVIMTIRDGEKFIGQSLRSITQQSYLPVDIVIVNDGSTDDTKKIIESYENRITPIRLINTKRVGRAKALNMAWKSAKGDWIANLDVDDCWHPYKLEKQVELLQSNPGCVFLTTEYFFVYGEDEVLWTTSRLFKNTTDLVWLEQKDFYSSNPINHSSILLNKSVLEKVNGYDERLDKLVDYDLWIRTVSLGYSIGKCPIGLTAKRLHNNQSFEAKRRLRYLTHALVMNYQGLLRMKAPILYYLKPPISFVLGIYSRQLRGFIRKVLRC